MENGFVLYLIGQSVIIIGAILTAYIRTRVSIAELKRDTTHIQATATLLREDHKELSRKVDGISSHVTTLEALHKQCPYVKDTPTKDS
jgi:hypothetical protein